LTDHKPSRAGGPIIGAGAMSDRIMRSRAYLSLLAACVALGPGCAELLPKQDVRTDVEWTSFDDARKMIQAIEPYKTSKEDLAAAGVTALNPAVTLLSHADVALRFPIGGVLNSADVDPGIRDCLKAGKGCNGYQMNIKRISNDRVGNFWLDAFRFRRETESRGWTFSALILFVDDRAVYAVYGGQPNVHETLVDRNPLGPLQGWGDWVSGQIYK
jgi:hypothetical protein